MNPSQGIGRQLSIAVLEEPSQGSPTTRPHAGQPGRLSSPPTAPQGLARREPSPDRMTPSETSPRPFRPLATPSGSPPGSPLGTPPSEGTATPGRLQQGAHRVAQLAGAVAGHVVQQAAAAGLPTFARELLAEGLRVGLLHVPAGVTVGLQVGVSLFNLGLQALRHSREARDPDAAARGAHAMTQEQWDALEPQEQEQRRNSTESMSRMITAMQVSASLTNIVIGAVAAAHGNRAIAGATLAGELKGPAYAAMRDAIQASFSMVDCDAPTHGASGRHLAAAAVHYGSESLVASFAGTAAANHIGPMNSAARNALAGLPSSMGSSEAWGRLLQNAGLRAAINTAVSAADNTFLTGAEAAQAGTSQRLAPRITGTDYERLLDQTPARVALLSSLSAAGNAIGVAGDAVHLSPANVDHAANALLSGMAGLTYYTFASNSNANAAVRASQRESQEIGSAYGPLTDRTPTPPVGDAALGAV